MFDKKVLVLTTQKDEYARALVDVGISLSICNSLTELKELLENTPVQDFNAVVLLADMGQNCHAAQLISIQSAHIFIVALTNGHTNPEATALLMAGANYILRPDNNVEYLLSVLKAKWQWQAQYNENSSLFDISINYRLAMGVRSGSWVLNDDGWLLEHDSGGKIRLAVSERIIVSSLFLAPGHFCSHQEIDNAFISSKSNKYKRAPDIRCLLNRLRNNAQEQGLPEPPIVSLRGCGYIWAI